MSTSVFLRLFPPPRFMLMKYAGLDISDDSLHWIEYNETATGIKIGKYGKMDIPEGVIEGGDIKDRNKLKEILTECAAKNELSFVRVSLPEEKVYLFQTEVADAEFKNLRQNIEFKIEENVPLLATDALFYFDVMHASSAPGIVRASVSVVPKSYIEQYISLLHESNLVPVAFEVVTKAIARAVVEDGADDTHMIINIMKRKTGIYITRGNKVCFTSTVGFGAASSPDPSGKPYHELLMREINRIHSYWASHGGVRSSIDKIILTGLIDDAIEDLISQTASATAKSVEASHPWQNSLNLNRYIPPISLKESLEYSVASGLAIPKIK